MTEKFSGTYITNFMQLRLLFCEIRINLRKPSYYSVNSGKNILIFGYKLLNISPLVSEISEIFSSYTRD